MEYEMPDVSVMTVTLNSSIESGLREDEFDINSIGDLGIPSIGK